MRGPGWCSRPTATGHPPGAAGTAALVVAGLATDLAEGRAQRLAVVSLVVVLAVLVLYAVHLSADSA